MNNFFSKVFPIALHVILVDIIEDVEKSTAFDVRSEYEDRG